MTQPPSIPAANPGAVYGAHRAAIDEAVARVLASGWYILGAEGAAFEREFAAWLGAPWAVGCANGTDALALALRGLGVGAGCSVATVSHTAVATVAAIEMSGATPVLLDIEPAHYTLDAAELAAVLAHPLPGLPPIRAVIAVHLYGQAADMTAILAACRAHGVALIEDCSQAHGASYGTARLGTLGDISTFSLYPTKNLGALGDGGIIATPDAALSERISALRQYGWRSPYVSDMVGVNSRLDEVQAAILRVMLPPLDARNARRQAIAARYDAALAGGAIAAPARRAGADHVFHQYVVRAPERDAVRAALQSLGIGTGVHYPVPVHLQPAYHRRLALGPAACTESEHAARHVLSVPVYPELTDAEVERVAGALHQVASGGT